MNDMIIDAEPDSGGAIATLPTMNLATIITTPGAMDALLDRIERDARAIRAGLDISTEKGRKAIGSLAKSKVANAKVQIVEAANKLTEGWRRDTAVVVADRKKVEARLDALRDEIEAEVVAYRAAKAATEKANEDAIAVLDALVVGLADLTSAEIEGRIKQAGIVSEFGWAPEFVQRAGRVFGGVAAQLHMADQTAKANEIEAEAEAIRQAEEVERQRLAAIEAQKAHEAAIAAEATRLAEIETARKMQREDYHRRMLQHVKGCGLGFIDEQPQPLALLQYELTSKIKYDEDNFGDLLPEALVARDEALKRIQRSVDESIRRAQEEEAREEAQRRMRAEAEMAARQAKEAAQAAQAALQAEAERTRRAEEVAQRLVAQAESNRVAEHRAALAVMEKLATAKSGSEATIMVDTDLATLAHIFDRDWAEFHDEAKGMHAAVEAALMRRHDAAQQRAVQAEADRKEAQRVRDEAAQTMAEAKARQELVDKQAAEDGVAAKRAANRAHQAKINGEVLEDIVRALAQTGIDYDDGPDIGTQIAKAVITAVAKGEVRHIKIEY